MPSPFPGMDPYIEACGRWNCFHAMFIGECALQLNQRLPRNFVARHEARRNDARWIDGSTERFIAIERHPERRVVATLEMLLPSRKSGEGHAAHLAQRRAYSEAHVNFVELDFLLGGQRIPLGVPVPPSDYYALVSRNPERQEREPYPISIRDRLPTIAVPLGVALDDVPLDLKAAFDQTYDGGRFRMLIHYSAPLPPELVGPDREWATEIARRAE